MGHTAAGMSPGQGIGADLGTGSGAGTNNVTSGRTDVQVCSVSQQQLDAVLRQHVHLHLAHPALTSLHGSAVLRGMLGVSDFTPAHLLELTKV